MHCLFSSVGMRELGCFFRPVEGGARDRVYMKLPGEVVDFSTGEVYNAVSIGQSVRFEHFEVETVVEPVQINMTQPGSVESALV